MLSFTFFVGIVLLFSPKAFGALNRLFQMEYGFRSKVIPKIEDIKIDVIDRIVIKNRLIAGFVISIASVVLLFFIR